jgi:hypothetical protein
MTPAKRQAVVKAIATAVCTILAAWKGLELEPDQLAEVLAFAVAVSQLFRRTGDMPPLKPGVDFPH